MAKISTAIRNSPPLVRHIGIALALLLIAAGVFYGSVGFSATVVSSTLGNLLPSERKAICGPAGKSAQKLTAEGTPSATEPPPADLAKVVKPLLPDLAKYPASDAERHRIADQALKAQRLECLHMDLLGIYVRNYYSSVVTSMVFGGIAAIAVFLVGPKGWSASNPYLVNVLLTSAAIAAFYGAFPGVFQQSTMVANHKTQILRYETLLDGMASHTASPNLVPSACPIQCARAVGRVCDAPFPPAAFIACTDAALATADVPFGLEPANQPDYQKAFGQSAPISDTRQ